MPINRELRFLDSFRFLPSSLDKLASNLTSDKLHNLRNCYPEENEFQLLQNKGLYPYDYIDDETKLSSEQNTHETGLLQQAKRLTYIR